MIKGNLYKDTEHCMEFDNKEIMDYFVARFESTSNVHLRILADYEEFVEESGKRIDTVCLDGAKEEFYVSFLGCQTSIFIKNTEIMFIDDNAKANYTTSDTMYNIVYEGSLRNLSHEQILTLIFEIACYFIGVTEINVHEEKLTKSEYYQKCTYQINVSSENVEKRNGVYSNLNISTK